MYGGPIGTHQSSFEWDHPRPPRPPLPRDWGFAIYLPPVISGTGKATDFKFGGYIYRANPNKSPLKFRRKWSVGDWRIQALQGMPKFLGYSLLSQEGIKLRTSNLTGTFTGPIRIKVH